MTDKQTQADGRPNGGAEDPSQESGLDALIKQYQQETGDKDQDVRVLQALKPVVDYVKSQKARDEQGQVEQAIDNAYKFVTGEESLKGLKKPVVRGLLEAYGLENPAFQEAWANQNKDPKGWEKALSEGRDWIKGQYDEIVKGVRNVRRDLEAAKAAVAGTSTDDSEGEKVDVAKLFSMSDSDFRKDLNEAIAKGSRQ